MNTCTCIIAKYAMNTLVVLYPGVPQGFVDRMKKQIEDVESNMVPIGKLLSEVISLN